MRKLTQRILKENLSYDPATGDFIRIKRVRGRQYTGIAGTIFSDGYRQIQVEGVRKTASHLAWLYVYGEYPDGWIDHINGIRDDNRISNLRVATPFENAQNQGIPKHNSSGIVGVRWNEQVRKWSAQISVKSKNIFIGYFKNKDDAVKARQEAKAKHHTFCSVVRSSTIKY